MSSNYSTTSNSKAAKRLPNKRKSKDNNNELAPKPAVVKTKVNN